MQPISLIWKHKIKNWIQCDAQYQKIRQTHADNTKYVIVIPNKIKIAGNKKSDR